MATAHAEALISILEYLNRLDRHFGSLLRVNQAHISQSDRHVADSLAQIAGGGREAPSRMFLPRGQRHRARS